MPGRLPHSPARIVAKWIADTGLGQTPNNGGTQPEWATFYYNEPNSPNNLINVTDTTPVPFRKDAFGDRNIHHGIQVKVRGGTHDVGWNKANTIAVAFDQLLSPVLVT